MQFEACSLFSSFTGFKHQVLIYSSLIQAIIKFNFQLLVQDSKSSILLLGENLVPKPENETKEADQRRTRTS
jgi:hypothetical protein